MAIATVAPGKRIVNTRRRATCPHCGPTVAMQLIRDGRSDPVPFCGFCNRPLNMAGALALMVQEEIGEVLKHGRV